MKKISKSIHSMDIPLFIITSLLFIFGLLNIVSASSQTAVIRYNFSLYSYFYKQLINIAVGVFLGIFIIITPTKSYKAIGRLLFYIVAFASLAVSFSSFGANYSGNENWINIHGFTFQPSEFAKIVMIVLVSVLFEKYNDRLRSKKVEQTEKYNMIFKIMIVGMFFPFIIFIQRDFGTLCIITAIFGVLFLSSPILRQDKFRTIIVCLIAAFFALLIYSSKNNLFSNAQSSRFDFFDPCKNYEHGGYQICNGFIAINSGGIIGNGVGKSKQISYIPESHTDSVFAIIAEQYGLIVTTLIFILYLDILHLVLQYIFFYIY